MKTETPLITKQMLNGGGNVPGQISKEKALELLPHYSFDGGWRIIIPEDKSFIKFVEPSLSDLD